MPGLRAGDAAVQRREGAARQPPEQAAPPSEAVRAELERLLSSEALDASDRRRAFLRFVVEETLAGRGERLKGYTIALAVFGRDESFDSQTDPVVRLEARRLRRDLDSYYVAAGSGDPVRIAIPKGSYVPRFEWQESLRSAPAASAPVPAEPEQAPVEPAASAPAVDPAGSRDRPVLLVAGALVVLLLAVAAAWFLLDRQSGQVGNATAGEPQGPSVVVLPFDALNDSSDSRWMAEGLAQELTGNLMRFPGFRLYTLPLRFDPLEASEPVAMGRELGLGYVVSGQVRVDAASVRVATQLYDANSGRVVWTATYDRPLDARAVIAVQSDLAGEIASALGPAYGAVNSDLGLLEMGDPGVADLQSYICVLRAYSYRRSFAREAFGPVLACLEAAVQQDPGYSDAWAMLGWLHLDAGRFEFAGPDRLDEEYALAVEAARHAVALDPENTLALKALSSIYHYLGRYEEAERHAREAAALNPYDPDTLAQLGWRLAVRGKFDEGIPILQRAIERTVNPPPWYFHLIGVDLYLKGDYESLLAVAQRSLGNGIGFGPMLLAIAAGALGDAELARQALGEMQKVDRIWRDPAAFLRRHGATEEIVAALLAGLAEAQRVAAEP